MTLFRRRRWPAIDLYVSGGPGAIKRLPSAELERLMNRAIDEGWSASGRPEWVRQHRADIREVTLVVFGKEASSLYRCIATVVLADGSGGRFTVDVSMRDLDALEDVSELEVVVMAHKYLATYPPVDLDVGPAVTSDEKPKTFKGSVWEAWGAGDG